MLYIINHEHSPLPKVFLLTICPYLLIFLWHFLYRLLSKISGSLVRHDRSSLVFPQVIAIEPIFNEIILIKNRIRAAKLSENPWTQLSSESKKSISRPRVDFQNENRWLKNEFNGIVTTRPALLDGTNSFSFITIALNFNFLLLSLGRTE